MHGESRSTAVLPAVETKTGPDDCSFLSILCLPPSRPNPLLFPSLFFVTSSSKLRYGGCSTDNIGSRPNAAAFVPLGVKGKIWHLSTFRLELQKAPGGQVSWFISTTTEKSPTNQPNGPIHPPPFSPGKRTHTHTRRHQLPNHPGHGAFFPQRNPFFIMIFFARHLRIGNELINQPVQIPNVFRLKTPMFSRYFLDTIVFVASTKTQGGLI